MPKEHIAQLTNHSTKLSSLMTSVADITKSIVKMHVKMQEGFQLQCQQEQGKDKEEPESGRTPKSSFILASNKIR